MQIIYILDILNRSVDVIFYKILNWIQKLSQKGKRGFKYIFEELDFFPEIAADNFSKFTGTYLLWSLFFSKVAGF